LAVWIFDLWHQNNQYFLSINIYLVKSLRCLWMSTYFPSCKLDFFFSTTSSTFWDVITQLQSSCQEMSEEDVSKLGVALLNCQSFVEGRRQYYCSNQMTLFECTREMDPTTWNAYHILSNRAHSLCFTLRQQQFRVQTEVLVNSLATSARDQVKTLQEGHERLSEATGFTLQQMLSGQERFTSQQSMLVKKQQEFQTSIGVNMQELTEQQSLAASSHQILAKMTDNIKDKIGERGGSVYTVRLQTNHPLLSCSRPFGALLTRVMLLFNFAGDRSAAVHTCITHLGFFLLAGFLAVFLQAPALQRGLLLLVIPTNALVKIQIGTSMDFSLLSLFILMPSVCGCTSEILFLLSPVYCDPYFQFLRSSTMRVSKGLCNAKTRAGLRCKKRAMIGEEFCFVHAGGRSSIQQIFL
uniref:Uncharacterized protein n=1 Tax=Eptatretus burgeri TaxID=7764 RepID=A0A8C4N6Q0_EPTBU